MTSDTSLPRAGRLLTSSIPDHAFILLTPVIALSALFLSHEDGHGSGSEMSTIAGHLVNGFGFISPYLDPSFDMKTTVCAPLYVWLMAAVYKLFGIETYSARLSLQLLNIALHCGTLFVMFRYCRNVLSDKAARWFAAIYCFHPHLIYLPFNIWETSLTTFLLALILYFATFTLATAHSFRLFLFGILLGTTSLSNPAWTLAYPLICLIPFWRAGASTTRTIRSLSIITLAFALVVSPWIARNAAISGQFIFVRGMSAPEFYKGNNPDAEGGHGKGFVEYYLLASKRERTRLSELGESRYNAEKLDLTLKYIKRHPTRYLQLTLQRITMWWSGDIDALQWYRNNNKPTEFSEFNHYYFIAMAMVVSGLISSLIAFTGLYLLRQQLRRLWCLLIYIFILPAPFFLMIIGFRYQAAMMPFLIIPAAHALMTFYQLMVSKLTQASGTAYVTEH